MSAIDAIATVIDGDRQNWTPSRLIDVFCKPELVSGFCPSIRKNTQRSDWHAGFCSYNGDDSYGPGVDGFEDGYEAWSALLASGWSLVQDPGDRQFPFAFYMVRHPDVLADPATPEGKWCIASYCEGDFGVEVYDDNLAYLAGRARVEAL